MTPKEEFGELAVHATPGNFSLRVYDDLVGEIWARTKTGRGVGVFRSDVYRRPDNISLKTWGEVPQPYDLTVAARPE